MKRIWGEETKVRSLSQEGGEFSNGGSWIVCFSVKMMFTCLTSFSALIECVIVWERTVSHRVIEDAEVRGWDGVSPAAVVATVTAEPTIRGRLRVDAAGAAAPLGEGRGGAVPIWNILWLKHTHADGESFIH